MYILEKYILEKYILEKYIRETIKQSYKAKL
jgi:hypothetical protein